MRGVPCEGEAPFRAGEGDGVEGGGGVEGELLPLVDDEGDGEEVGGKGAGSSWNGDPFTFALSLHAVTEASDVSCALDSRGTSEYPDCAAPCGQSTAELRKKQSDRRPM